MTRFWILQLQGRKLVRLVPPSENANAYPTDVTSFQPQLFTVDLMDPDYQQHPHLDNMLVYEAILEPGDVLFIPEGWGHQALNLEWNLMVTTNYVDQHNRDVHLEWMAWSHDVRRCLLAALPRIVSIA
jgi:ribosomal protein L16 Arg81 hydroxylase